jgi:hypothetical protein
MDLDLPDFKDTKSFTVGLRELIYSFSAVYPTAKIAEIVFTQPRPEGEQVNSKRISPGFVQYSFSLSESELLYQKFAWL